MARPRGDWDWCLVMPEVDCLNRHDVASSIKLRFAETHSTWRLLLVFHRPRLPGFQLQLVSVSETILLRLIGGGMSSMPTPDLASIFDLPSSLSKLTQYVERARDFRFSGVQIDFPVAVKASKVGEAGSQSGRVSFTAYWTFAAELRLFAWTPLLSLGREATYIQISTVRVGVSFLINPSSQTNPARWNLCACRYSCGLQPPPLSYTHQSASLLTVSRRRRGPSSRPTTLESGALSCVLPWLPWQRCSSADSFSIRSHCYHSDFFIIQVPRSHESPLPRQRSPYWAQESCSTHEFPKR
ncbi:hypothetical protein R3P38DRAFT_543141 [Favolaschia claudopus]|uniref:Uncharacterized protein n=1 Tax=Favolaschia claudopus TaxID=2862362 RepID=A0AAW0CE81_9AGAR